jgi:hypothetical protein
MGAPEIVGTSEGAGPDRLAAGLAGAVGEPERPPFLRRLLRGALGLDPADTSFARRRFRGDHAAVRTRLENVGQTFVRGFNHALEEDRPEPLARRLAEIELEHRGFAYEGAGMALAVLDWMTPWRPDRLARFLAGPGDPHLYIVIVGAGWISARLPVAPERVMAQHPVDLRWLALDGYGFHEGFFNWPRSVAAHKVPRRLRGYARTAFDFGLGRSLWFVDGADVTLLPRTIAGFPRERQPNLWSGLGLAVAYAGGRERGEIEGLRQAAGPYWPQLGQGAAFAAICRARAGNPAPHTDLAARVLCGCSADEAAAIAAAARPVLRDEPFDAPEPAYEVWRQRIQRRLIEGRHP